MREARAVSSLRHPGVVPLYDYGEANGWFFLVVEYIPGGSLAARLTEPLPPRIAAALVESIARAVAYLHHQGLLHLDLKPSNILLDGEPGASWDRAIPRVTDFGLAHFYDPDASATSMAGLRGPASFMAPEQVEAVRDRLGPATDVYSLGAVLYYVITGRPPFAPSSAFETLEQIRHQEPVPPRRRYSAIPRDLEAICLKCLEKDPARRYSSAVALADDLRRFQSGEPVLARPISWAGRLWRWCLRIRDRGRRDSPDRTTPAIDPLPEVQMEHFTGIVDAVRGGVAYLTLTDQEGREVEIEWDAADLRSKSIEEGHYFQLTTTTRGEEMTFEFRPVAPRPLSEPAKREIQELLSRYGDRGWSDDDEP
jgi:serine/threonine protein kinase